MEERSSVYNIYQVYLLDLLEVIITQDRPRERKG